MPRPRKKPGAKPATPAFDVHAVLDSAGVPKKIVEYGPGAVIFAQGDRCDSIMHIELAAATRMMTVSLRNLAGDTIYSIDLEPSQVP